MMRKPSGWFKSDPVEVPTVKAAIMLSFGYITFRADKKYAIVQMQIINIFL